MSVASVPANAEPDAASTSPAASPNAASARAGAWGGASPRRRRAFSTRFLRSELWLIFGRRRNWAGLATLLVVPFVIAVSIKIWPIDGGAGSGEIFAQITENGLFVALASLSLELPLFLPLAVAAISSDAIAGEANLGTLRYLLTVPAHRTRVIAVKYTAIVIFTFAAVGLVAAAGALFGLALFGASGTAISFAGTPMSAGQVALRLVGVSCYLAVCLSALGAIGMFVSSLTEQPIGGTIAIMVLTVLSVVLDTIPQLSWLHPYLFTHHWMAYTEFLRDPISFDGALRDGVLNAGGYVAVFLTAAWARFAGRDISS